MKDRIGQPARAMKAHGFRTRRILANDGGVSLPGRAQAFRLIRILAVSVLAVGPEEFPAHAKRAFRDNGIETFRANVTTAMKAHGDRGAGIGAHVRRVRDLKLA